MPCALQSSCRPKSRFLEPVHTFHRARDKTCVSAFLENAQEIFQAARQGGPEDCELAILVDRDGAIHMLPAAGWDLESLRLDHGAHAAYRVTRSAGAVRVEARSAAEACLLQARTAQPWRPPLADFPRYLTIQ